MFLFSMRATRSAGDALTQDIMTDLDEDQMKTR